MYQCSGYLKLPHVCSQWKGILSTIPVINGSQSVIKTMPAKDILIKPSDYHQLQFNAEHRYHRTVIIIIQCSEAISAAVQITFLYYLFTPIRFLNLNH